MVTGAVPTASVGRWWSREGGGGKQSDAGDGRTRCHGDRRTGAPAGMSVTVESRSDRSRRSRVGGGGDHTGDLCDCETGGSHHAPPTHHGAPAVCGAPC